MTEESGETANGKMSKSLRGLEARCILAQANVIGAFNLDKAEELLGDALHKAHALGWDDLRAGEHTPPLLFKEVPLLVAHWQDGQFDAKDLIDNELDSESHNQLNAERPRG